MCFLSSASLLTLFGASEAGQPELVTRGAETHITTVVTFTVTFRCVVFLNICELFGSSNT